MLGKSVSRFIIILLLAAISLPEDENLFSYKFLSYKANQNAQGKRFKQVSNDHLSETEVVGQENVATYNRNRFDFLDFVFEDESTQSQRICNDSFENLIRRDNVPDKLLSEFLLNLPPPRS